MTKPHLTSPDPTIPHRAAPLLAIARLTRPAFRPVPYLTEQRRIITELATPNTSAPRMTQPDQSGPSLRLPSHTESKLTLASTTIPHRTTTEHTGADHTMPARRPVPHHTKHNHIAPDQCKPDLASAQRTLLHHAGAVLDIHRQTKPNLTGLSARTMPNRSRPNRDKPCPTEANQARDDHSEPGQANPYPTLHHLSALDRT